MRHGARSTPSGRSRCAAISPAGDSGRVRVHRRSARHARRDARPARELRLRPVGHAPPARGGGARPVEHAHQHQVLDLMPRLARLEPRADAANLRMIPGSDIGYFGPYEALLRPHMPDRHCGSCGAGRLTLGLEANGDVKGVSVASLERLRRRQPARALAEGNLGAGVRPALHARSDGRRPARVRPQLLLRRGVPGRLHLDDSHALRQARRRSVLPPPRARAAAPGQARDTASRARRTGARA